MSAGASGASAFVGFAIPEVALTRLLAEDQAGRRFVREEGVQLQMVAYFICSSACQSPQRDGRDNTNFKFGNRLCSGFHARNCERELVPLPGSRELASTQC